MHSERDRARNPAGGAAGLSGACAVAERPPAPVPLLLDAKAAACFCGVSRSHWLSMHSAGLVPAPVRLGRSVRWNRQELEAWAAAGCPARERWEPQREGGRP